MRMTTRLLLTALALAPTLALPTGPVHAAAAPGPDYSKVEIKPTKLGDSITMLAGAGGNMAILTGPDGVILIDDQFAELSDKIKAAVAAVSDRPIRYLINTHWHGDHTGGNENFSKGGAIIVAHDNVRRQMSVEHFMKAFNSQVPPSPMAALPVITFNDSLIVHLNGEELRIFHVKNAHTDGDAIIHFANANVVHMGDTFFNGRFPFIDLDSGGSVRGLTQDIAVLLAELPRDVRLIPGHGPQGTMQDLQVYYDMLVEAQQLVAKALATGKDPAAMKQDKLLAKYASWSWAFIDADKFIDILVREAQSK